MNEKKVGRPSRYDEPMRQVGTRLPVSAHERLLTFANQQHQSVHVVVREVLLQFVAHTKSADTK